MSSALYVPIFVGELGWELINYVPYVNHIWSQKKYDAVHETAKTEVAMEVPSPTRPYPHAAASRP